MRSSKVVGLSLRRSSFIPELSSWNTPFDSPLAMRLYVFSSARGNASISRSTSLFDLTNLTVLSMTVRVLRPRKSNFTSPIFSTSFIVYWVVIESSFCCL